MEIHINRSLTHKPSIDKIRPSRRQPFIRSIFEFINERYMEPRNEPNYGPFVKIFLTAQWKKVIHKNRQLNEKFVSIP